MPDRPELAVIVCARDEDERLADTLNGLRRAFGAVRIIVADDGSRDDTPAIATRAGAELARGERPIGKGGAATRAALPLLEAPPRVVMLCDGDLGLSAAQLGPLAASVRAGECDLAIARFAVAVGGGLGIALGFARWTIRSLCGRRLEAPISGQRALRGELLGALVPFSARFGMELAMTVDALSAGWRVQELPLDLAHRATGRTLRGFVHRGRQLVDFALVYVERRLGLPRVDVRRVGRDRVGG